MIRLDAAHLVRCGLDHERATRLVQFVEETSQQHSGAETWSILSRTELRPDEPFEAHLYLYDALFKDWDAAARGPRPAWVPTDDEIAASNVHALMQDRGLASHAELVRWAGEHRDALCEEMVRRLDIRFEEPREQTLNLQNGAESAAWFPGARMNIVSSCFQADTEQDAIVFQAEKGPVQRLSYGALHEMVNRVANGLRDAGFEAGDRIAIDMVMTAEAVAIYLGIVKAGCVAVSIADSFAPDEIRTRLQISGARGIFTQDVIPRGGRKLPLYDKVTAADAPRAIVLPAGAELACALREGDLTWEQFLGEASTFDAVTSAPDSATNILFSSGTTGDPKAIPWSHLQPIRSAMDGHLHQDIHPGDVVAWPTNLGWMMGPWLIYAALINRATIALYYGAPMGPAFGDFVSQAKVTMLGLVPSMVRAWRATGCMQGVDWSAIRAFSSTGECSNAEDYLFLMKLAGYKPVIEYCGGTEIGGGYISGTVAQMASPGTFSTPCFGHAFFLLDEEGHEANPGELYLTPPAVGLSDRLLNRDHHEIYYEGVPAGPQGQVLRRHGDQMERLPGGYFRGLGRADDTMNLGGIKTSSAQIERVLNGVDGVSETAAVAVEPEGGGPSQLVIYAVVTEPVPSPQLQKQMQNALKIRLNPLFRISDLVIVDVLPRTASNKVMRRVLRAEYQPSS